MRMNVKNYATLQAAMEQLSRFLIEQSLSQENIFDCKLVACELLGNVLKHGDGDGELLVDLQDEFVVIKVVSGNTFVLPEQITCSDLLAEGGRGLFLVNSLCEGNIQSGQDGIVVKIRIRK